MITFNEERRVGRTLEAAGRVADEIIVVDNHSTDRTVDIVKSHGGRVFTEDWKGFGPQKNSVIEKCSGEWILFIDADEVLSDPLIARINAIKNGKGEADVYRIRMYSHCFGKIIRFGGWSNQFRVKLFRKDAGRYDGSRVHEKFITRRKAGKIKEHILHYTYLTLEDYLSKFNHYTTEGAREAYKKNRRAGVFNLFINPVLKFIRMYLLKGGFLDGKEGLLLAILSADYTMVKYFKLREMIKNRHYMP